MGVWNLFGGRSGNTSKTKSKKTAPRRGKQLCRIPMLETLESRFVLTGPALQGIFTDGMVALHAANDPYHQAPNEFIIQFDANQQIDPTSLGGISFLYGSQTVTPGYVGIGTTPNQVIARFDGAMQEGTYTLQIAGTGSTPLKNIAGEKFNSGQSNETRSFVVNTAAQVVSVVPQPVTRSANGTLSQSTNQIVVYFNQSMGSSVTNVTAYQLFNTNGTLDSNDDAYINPLSVIYNSNDKSATLTFATNLGQGNYRLRVGNAETPVSAPVQINAPTDPTDTFTGANAAGNTVVLGTGNTTSAVISGASIQNTQTYNSLVYPGSGNEPGSRDISIGGPDSYSGNENGIGSIDSTPGITVQQFNFKAIYGTTATGGNLVNQITEVQKLRIRQALSLWSQKLGIEFVETADQGWTFAVGDTQTIDPHAPSTAYRGIADTTLGLAVISSAQNWGASDFGSDFQIVALHEIGVMLGLQRNSDAPDSIMNGGIEDPTIPITLVLSSDSPLPGYIDTALGQVAQRPESRDIDLYKVQLTEGGTLRVQTIAQRLTPQASLLNSVITIYDQNRNIVARNDDYYGTDSYIELKGLAAGSYYIAVTSTGNTNFNPAISDSGSGGTTEGAYQLRVDFDPTAKPNQILDSTGLVLDGDGDGIQGGEFNFWFQVGNTIFVDKANDKVAGAEGNGSAANPYDNIASAINAAASRIIMPTAVSAIKSGDTFTLSNGASFPLTYMFTDGSISLPLGVIGIQLPANVGQLASNIATAITNAGINITASVSGTVVNLSPSNGASVNLDLSGTNAFVHTPNIIRVIGNQSPSDNYSYLIGQGRADGSSIVVPQAVTLMIDAGAILKFDQSAITVGDSQTNINRAGGAIQILGTPKSSVVLTSIYDDAFGGDVAGTGRGAAAADWAGIVFRAGSDHEKDGIFLNFIAGTTIAYGGGQNQDSSQQTAYSAVDIMGTRPTIISSILRQNSGAAMSADPNSFAESNYGVNTTMNVDYSRLGLNVYGVTLALNGQNGLAIRSQSSPGSAAQEVSGTIHLNDTGIVHIVTQDLLLAQGLNGAMDVTYKGTSPYIAPNYVVLDSTASSVDDYYVGQKIDITDASGNVIQTRKIISYNGLTKRAIVDQAWGAAVLGVKPNQRFVISGRLATPGANLVIDGGTIIKLSNTRIDAQFGSQILAEGTADAPIILTSILDDSYGAAGSFDTTGNGSSQLAAAGNWAGVYFAPTSTGSFDYVRLSYAGGTSSVQGTVDSFNPVEINQAQVRIAHSTIANNLGGQAATSRSGLGTNVSSAIFVRGAQPILVGNTILNSLGAAISIDASSLNNILQGDTGRQTGLFGKYAGTDGNYGAIVVGNVLTNDQINGMNVRGGNLSTESIWDDTDIVHVVLNQITVLNKQIYGGLRILSTAAASLVVKFQTTSTASPAGIKASGTPLDIPDRIGGTLQIIGTPAHSVIMTTLGDDTVGAGVDIFGKQLTDTNNDKGASLPVPGSWNGITIDQYANDRNVKQVIEQEAPSGSTDSNAVASKAENLGTLAANINSGDENNRLGFVVSGSIAYDRPSDNDVYKFTAVAGTEVWLDIDKTWGSLGALLELVDANGNVLARSDGNDDASNTAFGNNSSYIQSLDPNTVALRMEKDSSIGPDTYSTNFINTGGNTNGVSRDPGMRVFLPGQAGTSQTYYIRVRSSPAQAPTFNGINTVTGGLSVGNYELQVRLQQADETAGTTIRYADIRNAVNGISVTGQPDSPLTSTSGDSEGTTGSGQNDTSATAQDLGNILASDQSTISINGYIASNPVVPGSTAPSTPAQDVDWYKFNVNYDFVQAIKNANDAGQSFSAIFDLDYGAGSGRIDTTISVYQQTIDPATGQVVLQLVLVGRDSNVVDDQANTANLSGNGSDLLNRGSQGNGDPFIGSVLLPAGLGQLSIPRVYFVAISSSGRNPTPLNQFYQHLNADNLVRLQPIDSVNIIASDHLSVTTPQLEDPRTSTYDNLYPTNPSSGNYPTAPNNQAAAGNPLFGVGDSNGQTTTYKSSLTLGANATPLTLADVSMWSLSASGLLQILNPYTGQTEVFYPDATKLGNIVIHSMAMRPDGLIYAIADGDTPDGSARYVTINPSTGAVSQAGTVTLRGNVIVNSISAMTFTGVDPGNADADGFTAVGATSWGQYIAMRARDGVANVDAFGLKAPINANRLAVNAATSGSQVTDGNTITITAGGSSGQATVFEINKPLGLNVVNVPASQPVNNGTDPDLVLDLKVGNTQVKIELNTNGTAPVSGQFQVQVNAGTTTVGLANAIAGIINSVVASSAFVQGTEVFVKNGTVTAPLTQSGSGGVGPVITIDPAAPDGSVTQGNTAIEVVGVDANGNLHFLQGSDLANSIATQINTKLSNQGVVASVHVDISNPNQFDIDIPLWAQVSVSGSTFSNPSGPIPFNIVNFGNITGLAYIDAGSSGLSASRVYAVTSTGNFLVLNATTGLVISFQNFANTSFTGLTRMPQNVMGSAFSDFLMASTSQGNLLPLQILQSGNVLFASPQTTAVDILGNRINVLVGGLSSVQNLNIGSGGIIFSPFDFNIWHATTQRSYDTGHGINETYDQSITQNTLPGDQYLGGTSFAFNLDTRSTNAAGDPDVFGPNSYGATNTNDPVGSVFRFRSDILDTYNLPGGSAGSLTTNTFSLSGYSAQDMPTLYFNYYLQTEDALAYNAGSSSMRDSLRVFVSDDGVTWHQVATNDSTPSNYYDPTNYVPPQGYRQSELPESYSAQGGQYVGQSNLTAGQNSQTRVQELFDDVTAVSTIGGKSTPFVDPDSNDGVGNPKQWRQARIDLGDFAGMSNLRIRFDFSSAGDMQEPTKLAVTVPKVGNNSAAQNLALLDGSQFTLFNPSNNQLMTFELDTNNSLTNPSAKKIAISLKTPGQQLTNEELAAQIVAAVNQFASTTNIGAMTMGLTGTVLGDINTAPSLPQDPTIQGVGVNQNIIRFDLANSSMGTKAVLFLNSTAQQYFSTPQVTSSASIGSVFGVQPARLAEADSTTGQLENLQGDSFGNYNSLSRAQNNGFEGAYIDDLIIGFASRGEMVTRPTIGLGSDGKYTVIAQPTNQDVFVNSPVSPNPNAPKPATGGSYHLEIRPGVPYGTALTTYDMGETIPGILNPGDAPRVYTGLANVILTNSFDINDRLTHSFNIVAKAGNSIFDGSSFSVNDGTHAVTFEFDLESSANPSGNGVTAGRVRIGYKATDADWQVADKIALAIRSATTLGFRLDSTATTANLDRAAFDKVLSVDPISGLKTFATPNPNSAVVILTNTTDVTPRSQPIASGISVVEYGATNKFGQSSAYGDSNIPKQQGTIIIESSRISQSAVTGIALASERDTNGNRVSPGVPTNFNSSSGNLGAASAVPGVVLVNNIINGFGQVGISINGDPNTSGPVAAAPSARVENNTIFGSLLQTGIGILVGNNASPTLLNNIIAGTDTAIQTATNSTAVIVAELYWNNKQNRTIIDPTTAAVTVGDIGNQSFVQPIGQQIFVNAAAGNFYLRPGTAGSPNLAIDSAVDSLGERSDLAALKASLGMLPSSIVSPTVDINNQVRVDDPSVTTPPGVGNNSFKDRGAIERSDFNGPFAFLATPQDNAGGDTNSAIGAVTLTTGFGLTKFEVGLADIGGTGIDQQSIDATDVVLTLNGQVLTQGKDYIFSFDTTRNVIVLTSAGAQFRGGTYLIALNNTANGIVDKAGNPVLPNTSDGKTVFTVVLNLTGPTGVLSSPKDGGPTDLNSAPNDVTVKTATGLTVFEVSLSGGVGGINDATVDATKVQLFRNGTQLTIGTDYVFSYDPATDKIRLTSVGQLFVPGQYSIRITNTQSNGILDNSGSPIVPNRNDGSVVYNATLLLAGPIATVSAPADNGSSDTNPLPNYVQVVRTTGLPEIDIVLAQDTAAINASTVTASTVKLYRGGVLLVRGTDYNFGYNSAASTIVLVLTDLTKIPADYTVVLDNSASTGIRDLSGARLQPNQSDGSTTFFVSVVTPGPVASLVSPLDGSSADKDPTPNNVLFYSQSAVNQFQILLNQVGFAIDDSTVTASKILVTKDGQLLQLGVDYAFTYQASTDTITISSVNSDFQPGIYDIRLDNSSTGILDVQGNKLRSNRPSGATEFVISFAPPGPISIPQGIFISNLGLSDFNGSTYIGFNLQGDPLSKVTVTIDAKVDPSGTDTQLLNTTLFVSANGILSFSKLLPVDLNGETLNITVTNEFGQVINASSLIGPRATFTRAYVSSLFNDLLGRDGVLNETTDQFSPIEALVTFPAMAQSIIGSAEFAGASAAALVKSILGRTATPQEIATYSAQFIATGSFNQARIALLTSDEFAQLPSDLSLDYNNAAHRAAVTSYVQRVYAVLLPGVTLTPAQLTAQVQNVFEGGRKWIITNNSDGGILGSLAFKQSQVTQAYVKFLGRTPTSTELSSNVNLSDRDLVKSVVTTSDYVYTQLAESIYREYLQLSKNQVDPAKVQALVQSLKGGETENEARADVLASADFRTNSGNTLDSFVENVYRQILLTAPSSTDIANGKTFVNSNGGDTVQGRRAYALLLLSDPSYQNNSEGTLITGGIQSTSSGAGSPVISAISQVVVSEGQVVQFNVASTTPSGKAVTYSLVNGPAGASIDSQTGKFYWDAPDSFAGVLPIIVQASDSSNPLLKTAQTFLVEVNNIAPTVTVYASSSVIGGTPTTVTLAADDPSSVDADANFTFNIDWNGDGVVDQSVVGPSGLMLQHVFNTPGPQNIIVTAMDKDGGVSDPASTTVFVSGVFMGPDAVDPTKQDLYVVGSDGVDNITITQSTKDGPITVLISTLNGVAVNQTYQFTNVTGNIVVSTFGGNDAVNAKGVQYTALSIDGGTGNDSIVGGNLNDTIKGGDGNDTIWGNLGNDVVDGGAGDDLIFGDAPNNQEIALTRVTLGKDSIYGGSGNDTIYGDGDGGEGASDYIDAGDGDDTVFADGSEGTSPSADTVLGGAGNDLIFGDSPSVTADKGGNDSIDGGSGNDVIYGGGGADTLLGGTGSDLIIAGYTTNLDVTAFQNIQREWLSGRSMTVRRDAIMGKRFDGANSFTFISPGGTGNTAANILEDNAVDSVFAGDDTDGDWILATSTVDSINDAHLNEDIIDSLKP